MCVFENRAIENYIDDIGRGIYVFTVFGIVQLRIITVAAKLPAKVLYFLRTYYNLRCARYRSILR